MALQPQIVRRPAIHSLIAYGSNLSNERGESRELVEIALKHLSSKGIRILQRSGHFRSPAWPPGSGPDYVNGLVLCASDQPAVAILRALNDIEAALGRQRLKRWGARVIDLDLIDHGGAILPDAATQAHWRTLPPERQASETPQDLILPHPRLQDRAFVLVPLAQVAPDWVHPATGQSVAQMIAALDPGDVAAVTPLGPD